MTTGTGMVMADNSHADRKVAKRQAVTVLSVPSPATGLRRKRTCYPYSISDAIARIDEREAERLEYGDYPRKRATRFDEAEREPD